MTFTIANVFFSPAMTTFSLTGYSFSHWAKLLTCQEGSRELAKKKRYTNFNKILSYCWWKKILHQLISSLSHYLQGFYTSKVVSRISSIPNLSWRVQPKCWREDWWMNGLFGLHSLEWWHLPSLYTISTKCLVYLLDSPTLLMQNILQM